MDYNKLEKKIAEILNNLDTVKISNAMKAQVIRNAIEEMNKVVFMHLPNPNEKSHDRN